MTVSKTPLIIIKKDTFDVNVPSQDLISNEHHIFWIPKINTKPDDDCNNFDKEIKYDRMTAKALVDINRAKYIISDEFQNKKLYNLQFEEETSFIVNNIRCDSVSPHYHHLYLEKNYYFNKEKYNDEPHIFDQKREQLGLIPSLKK